MNPGEIYWVHPHIKLPNERSNQNTHPYVIIRGSLNGANSDLLTAVVATTQPLNTFSIPIGNTDGISRHAQCDVVVTLHKTNLKKLIKTLTKEQLDDIIYAVADYLGINP